MGKRKHSTNLMFIIALLCMFAMSALFVAAIGANVYENSATKLQDNYDTRTSIVYLSEKIRACADGAADVRDLDGNNAIVITTRTDGQIHESWIYVYDGHLREATKAEGVTLDPRAGQRIMSLTALTATKTDTGIDISVTTDSGYTHSTTITRRVA